MGDLKTENTSYPTSLDTATLIQDNGSDEIVAAHQNGPNSAILAIEAELGVSVKGTSDDLAARLQVMLDGDGGLLRGSEFPASPELKPHLFYRTDTKRLYLYNTSTASYDVVPTTVTLGEYVAKGEAGIITAAHTFNPAAPGVPFVLGANAQNQLVTNLNADKIDGVDAGNGSGNVPISNGTVCTNLNADKVDGFNATATATATSIPVSDSNAKLDTWVTFRPTTISTPARTADTVYQNTTGYPMMVVCAGPNTNGSNTGLMIGATTSAFYGACYCPIAAGTWYPMTGYVPVNYYYKLVNASSVLFWTEYY